MDGPIKMEKKKGWNGIWLQYASQPEVDASELSGWRVRMLECAERPSCFTELSGDLLWQDLKNWTNGKYEYLQAIKKITIYFPENILLVSYSGKQNYWTNNEHTVCR